MLAQILAQSSPQAALSELWRMLHKTGKVGVRRCRDARTAALSFAGGDTRQAQRRRRCCSRRETC
jgi:hypothetical protein